MEKTHPSVDSEKLKELAHDPRISQLSKADRLTLILTLLYRRSPDLFQRLDRLTWPEGQAILISSRREDIERTNPTAQIHQLAQAPFFVDTGHDNSAMRRLLEIAMGKLGYDQGTINEIKKSFVVNDHSRSDQTMLQWI